MFDSNKQIAKMQVPINKFIGQLKAQGIEVSLSDPLGLENIVLTFKGKTVKISHHSFYRLSGIACVTKEGKEKNSSEWVDVTDEMWCQIFLKQIVEALFK